MRDRTRWTIRATAIDTAGVTVAGADRPGGHPDGLVSG